MSAETCDMQSPASRMEWLIGQMPPWMREQMNHDRTLRELAYRAVQYKALTFPGFLAALCEALFTERNQYRDKLLEKMRLQPPSLDDYVGSPK